MKNLTDFWFELFGTNQWFGIDIGFWVSMAICFIIVIAMNAVFWSLKPIAKVKGGEQDEANE